MLSSYVNARRKTLPPNRVRNLFQSKSSVASRPSHILPLHPGVFKFLLILNLAIADMCAALLSSISFARVNTRFPQRVHPLSALTSDFGSAIVALTFSLLLMPTSTLSSERRATSDE
jgi:hypothetical protein